MSRVTLESPAVVGVFARAGHGKTVDLVRAGPRCLHIVEPGALAAATTILGYTPPNIQGLFDIDAVLAIFKKYAVDPQYDGIAIDDLTRLSLRSESAIKQKASGWKVWDIFGEKLRLLFDTAREYKKFVLFNGHEREARTTQAGQFIRGGIDLPMKLTESVSGAVDGMFRVLKFAEEDAPIHPHPFAFYCPAGDTQWAVKTRLGNPGWSPMNLGEILRSVDYKGGQVLRRAPGLEWQDKAVQVIAERLLATDRAPASVKEVLKVARDQMIGGGKAPAAILWTLHDAEDRARLLAAQQSRLNVYG